jgi:AcrB/AcrD/AcrF family protein
MTILMVQLQSFQRLFLVLATAPLALIGVAGALLMSGAPMGFVAILGIVSLVGMVIRNSVILIDQIETEIANGRPGWEAVIVATQHRLRPILLTAAAAILGMIPIAPTVFWGPMAYAVMGGLVVATLLTLVFLPALYVAWFRLQPVDACTSSPTSTSEGRLCIVAWLSQFQSRLSPPIQALSARGWRALVTRQTPQSLVDEIGVNFWAKGGAKRRNNWRQTLDGLVIQQKIDHSEDGAAGGGTAGILN